MSQSENIVRDIDILKLKTIYNIDFLSYEKDFLNEYKGFASKNCHDKYNEELKDIKTFKGYNHRKKLKLLDEHFLGEGIKK